MTKRLAVVISAVMAVSILAACSKTTPTPAASSAPEKQSSASSAPAGQTFSDHGVTFSYPDSWKTITGTTTTASAGSATWSESVGVSPIDLVLVSEYPLAVTVDPMNMDPIEVEATNTIGGLFKQGGGTMESGPTRSTMGGFPSLEYTGTVKAPDGTLVSSRVILAFNGTTEYFVNCQSTDAQKAEISAGCDQVVASFQAG